MMTDETEVIDVEFEEIETEAEHVTESVAVVRREAVAGLIRPVAQPAEVLEAQEDVRKLVEQALKPGRDYDTIPGTSKPTLLKPGSERINAAFGCAPRYRILEKEIDHDRPNEYVKRTWAWHPTERGKKVWTEEPGTSAGLYRYVLLCQLVHRESGVAIGEGVGSCSTMESKYIDRPRDLENTVLKMAKKRAQVDCVLTCGFLIHVPPERLKEAFAAIDGRAQKWVVFAEYYAPKCTELEYRGEDQMLWANDFAGLFMDEYPWWVLSGCGFAYHRDGGMDDLTWFRMMRDSYAEERMRVNP